MGSGGSALHHDHPVRATTLDLVLGTCPPHNEGREGATWRRGATHPSRLNFCVGARRRLGLPGPALRWSVLRGDARGCPRGASCPATSGRPRGPAASRPRRRRRRLPRRPNASDRREVQKRPARLVALARRRPRRRTIGPLPSRWATWRPRARNARRHLPSPGEAPLGAGPGPALRPPPIARDTPSASVTDSTSSGPATPSSAGFDAASSTSGRFASIPTAAGRRTSPSRACPTTSSSTVSRPRTEPSRATSSSSPSIPSPRGPSSTIRTALRAAELAAPTPRRAHPPPTTPRLDPRRGERRGRGRRRGRRFTVVESRRDRRERSARRSSPGHRRGRGPRRGRSHPRRRRRGVHRGGWGPRHQTPDVSLARSRCLRSLRRRGRRPRARGLGPGIRFWYRFGFGPEPRVPRRGDEERRARRSVSPTDGSGGRRPRDVVQARRRRRLPRFRRRRRKRRRERGSVPPKCIFRGFGFGFGFGSSRRARRSDSPLRLHPVDERLPRCPWRCRRRFSPRGRRRRRALRAGWRIFARVW